MYDLHDQWDHPPFDWEIRLCKPTIPMSTFASSEQVEMHRECTPKTWAIKNDLKRAQPSDESEQNWQAHMVGPGVHSSAHRRKAILAVCLFPLWRAPNSLLLFIRINLVKPMICHIATNYTHTYIRISISIYIYILIYLYIYTYQLITSSESVAVGASVGKSLHGRTCVDPTPCKYY